jgi:hypothetical protein
MSSRVIITVGIVLALGLAAASTEYGQYSALMRETARADVEQLCASLRAQRQCPAKLSLPKRHANDPWGQSYRCRSTADGQIYYTLGADRAPGGTNRDADIACATFSDAAGAQVHACSCSVGDNATQWLR